MNPLAWALPAAANATQAESEGRDRVQPGCRQRDAAQREGTEVTDGQPDRRAGEQFVHQVGDRALGLEHERHHAEHEHENDGGRVVETGLGLEQTGQPPGQRKHPQHREHRGGVGRGDDGAQQQRELPVHAKQHMRTHRGDHRADDHTDGGQRGRGCQHLADVGEPGGQTAFDEDDGQRRGADVPGQFDVVELQPEPVLAEQHSDRAGRTAGWETPPGSPPGYRQCWPAARSHRSTKPDTAAASSFRSVQS